MMVMALMPSATLAADSVIYLDESGTQQTADGVTVLTGSDTTLSAGWYLVSGELTFEERITISGDVHLILEDGCTMNAAKGITVSGSSNSLTIYAQSDGDDCGSLTATGSASQAGIGGEDHGSGDNITINGGIITATGGSRSAGIGGGCYGDADNITINGGTVTAQGGKEGAGIGGGSYGSAANITINGGTVTAIGGELGAGIGGGRKGSATNITINGGTVTATGNLGSAGIGGGDGGSGSNITINDGTVTATGDYSGAGIGGGDEGSGSNITINGGTVTAVGHNWSAGIGGGDGGSGNNITITGGTVTAIGSSGAAGIGGGLYGSSSDVIIEGSSTIVIATAGENAEAIGSGYKADSSSEDVERRNGLILENGAGVIYGTVTLTGDLSVIPENTVIEVPEECVLTITFPATFSEGVTFVNSGTVYADCQVDVTYTGTGKLVLFHDFCVKSAEEEYLKSEADCENAAEYYVSCSLCGASSEGSEDESTFTYGDPLGHSYVEEVADKYLKSSADAENAAVYYTSCSRCGNSSEGTEDEDTFTYGEPLGHIYWVIFDANGGEGEMEIQKISVDEATALSANSFSRSEYDFISWNTQADGNGKTFQDQESVLNIVPELETLTLYAQWARHTGTLSMTSTVSGTFATDIQFTYKIGLYDEQGVSVSGTFDEIVFTDGFATVTLHANETVKITGIPAGYSYRVTQTDIPDGYRWDGKELSGTIVKDETQEVVLSNIYEATGSSQVSAQVILCGADVSDYQFTFSIFSENEEDPISQGSSNSDGVVEFETIKYTEEDAGKTFTYTVIQETDDSDLFKYDTSEKALNVLVEDNGDGTLNVTSDWGNDNNVFINQIATGALPAAGGISRLNVILSVMIITVLIGIAVPLSKRMN